MKTIKSRELVCDAVIAGCGVAGLYTALKLGHDKQIIMICKEDVSSCDSMLAQGGICVLHDEDDYDAFFEDTMKAGHYENRKESVDIMIRSSRKVIEELISYGVDFNRTPEGELDYTKEGAHSRPRICYHKDITGKEITTKLLEAVRKLDNVTIMEYTVMTDIMVSNSGCNGLVCQDPEGTVNIYAKDTVLATGGIGGLYEHSTNFPSLTGDGCRICGEHGIRLENMDYVQIHPTSLYHKASPGDKKERSFLISESCRGEGAVLLNHKGERFTDELQPRDVVTNAIHQEMAKEGVDHEYLSFAALNPDEIKEHFPNIYAKCLEEGYDILKEPIPIVPAQHYFMGGIWVDSNSQTSMDHLYAAGETSCNGVHGRNRLASNSLLESLVFAGRAASKINSAKVANNIA